MYRGAGDSSCQSLARIRYRGRLDVLPRYGHAPKHVRLDVSPSAHSSSVSLALSACVPRCPSSTSAGQELREEQLAAREGGGGGTLARRYTDFLSRQTNGWRDALLDAGPSQ